jgi:hypothetical protein
MTWQKIIERYKANRVRLTQGFNEKCVSFIIFQPDITQPSETPIRKKVSIMCVEAFTILTTQKSERLPSRMYKLRYAMLSHGSQARARDQSNLI